TNLRFCLIPLGYRNIAHVVSEPHHIKVLCLVPTCCSTRPRADTLSNSFLGSMSNNANPWDAHAREDVAELAVTVSSLIEVHKVHVDRCPWKLLISLGMEVQQWLAQRIKAANPHLCW